MSADRGRPKSGPPAEDNATQANLRGSDMPLDTSTLVGGMTSMPAGEEPTMQGASFLVERITPVPPARDTMLHNPPSPPRAASAAAPAPADPGRYGDATATVINPGRQAPQAPQAPQPPQPNVRDSGTASVQVRPVALPPGASPIARGPRDAPPDIDTAFVPVPGKGPGGVPGQGAPTAAVPTVNPYAAAAQPAVLAATPPPSAATPPRGKASPITTFLQKNFPNLLTLADRVNASKSARLGLIAVCGMLGIGVTFLAFSPRQPVQRGQVVADNGPAPPPPPPSRPPPTNVDPVQQEERDRLLEKGVLAVEAGRGEEALAIFRRYADEDDGPAAAFMVQLLQAQLSQNGKEQP